jgi:hypothetical protein
MADDYSISYSYQSGPQGNPPAAGPTPAMDTRLYAFATCDRVTLDDTSVMLLNRCNGRQMAISPEVATALTYCGTFKTLQAHAETLVASIPQLQGQLEDVTGVLHMVRDAGLMLAAEDICANLQLADGEKSELAPTRVCVITCDRPPALERLLDSMLRAGSISRNDQLFLVDDSRNPDNRTQNRELVAKFNLTSPRDMLYVGADAQRQIISELTATLPRHEDAIRFLADRDRWEKRETYGLARTFCLLLTVGYRCVVMDDDILCATVQPPLRNEGISFGGGDGRELACFSSEEELMRSAAYGEVDPISGLTQCLGMGLGQALETLGMETLEANMLQDTRAALLGTLDRNSRILVTQCGSWGDPGTAGSHWFFHLGRDSVERALSVSGGLSGALENRHYWLGRSRPNIDKMAIMSQATGLDNSRLLPPYFPAFRGEDYLFASMVVCLHPDSAVLDYAWSIPHLPLEKRGAGAAREPIAARAGLGLCARYLSNRASYEPGPCAETRLRSLAAHLCEVAEQEPDSLLATFRRELAQQHGEQLRLLREQLKAAPSLESSAWEGYLQRGIEEVNRNLQTPASLGNIPGVDPENGDDALIQVFQAAIADFGRAIAAWPAIRNTAQHVTARLIDKGQLAP